VVDVGSGSPLVLIPGIQGRWEWMEPAVAALARQCRVITGSLPDEEADFDRFVGYVDGLLDSARVSRATLCGVSFGGLIALRYAARRPERARALVLVSTPGPGWKPSPHYERYMRRPIVSSPLFFLGALRRFSRELGATSPDLGIRLRRCAVIGKRVVSAPGNPVWMSKRARLAATENFVQDCASVAAPTLVITGERDLDRVVDCDDTMRYLTLIPGAQFQLLEKTGHSGIMLAPERFSEIVVRWMATCAS
jgi:3-oxoadipate enol-lactonase